MKIIISEGMAWYEHILTFFGVFFVSLSFPIGFLFEIFYQFNLKEYYFIIKIFIAIYLATFLVTIILIILKIINIKYKSNKIKKINKMLSIFFYIFMFIYLSWIPMLYIIKKLDYKKDGHPEMEHVGNSNYRLIIASQSSRHSIVFQYSIANRTMVN